MKIHAVKPNTRKQVFEVHTEKGRYDFPFVKLRLEPTKKNPVETVFPDPELGNEAFTYRLRSGEEDSVHGDAVLEVAKDPDLLQDLLIHKLTVEARGGFEKSGLGVRQVARNLGTSPTQVYRLLDPENTRKSVGQLLALLDLVEKKVELVVRPKVGPARPTAGRFEIYKGADGTFRFRLRGHRGELLLSSHGYSSKNSCLRAINSVRRSAGNMSRFQRTGKSGKYRFQIKARNHRAIATSPSFASASKRDSVLSMVREEASEAPLDEAVSEVE